MPLYPEPFRRGIAAAGAPGSALQMLQSAVLVIAALYFGSDLLIPLALSVLLAFVLAPVTQSLRRVGLPRVPAVLLAVALALVLVAGIAGVVGRQASALADNLPGYQAAISEKLSGLRAPGGLVERVTAAVRGLGQSLHLDPDHTSAGALREQPRASSIAGNAAPAERQAVPVVVHEPEPTTLQTLRRVANPLVHPLATVGVVVILVTFILLYREDLRDRLIRLAGARDLLRAMAAMDDAAYRLSRFFLAQVGLNTGFGIFIALMLWLIGIPNPLLWGLAAGLMRFVPFIGSPIAAVFPVLLAIAVDPGWTTVVLVLALYVVGEVAMGQVFEPLVFGHSTGLSPIAVIASATFWAWLWGPIGLLLAVPLTICLVVLGRHVDQLEFLEVMLGDQPPLDRRETFYQRALAGDVDALAEQSERALEEGEAESFLDAVTLPALRLAQADAARQVLAPERMERLREAVLTLLEDIDGEAGQAPAEGEAPPTPVPDAWRAPGAVLCLSGRGPFDELLTATVAQALRWRGFGVQQMPAGGAAAPGAPPRLAILCLMEGGSSAAAARYLLRRMRRRLPGVALHCLAWRGEEDGEERLASALRAEGDATAPVTLATRLREAVAQAVAKVEHQGDVAPVAEGDSPQPAVPAAPTPA